MKIDYRTHLFRSFFFMISFLLTLTSDVAFSSDIYEVELQKGLKLIREEEIREEEKEKEEEGPSLKCPCSEDQEGRPLDINEDLGKEQPIKEPVFTADLASEALQHIFPYLSAEDYPHLIRVNKKWSDLAQDSNGPFGHLASFSEFYDRQNAAIPPATQFNKNEFIDIITKTACTVREYVNQQLQDMDPAKRAQLLDLFFSHLKQNKYLQHQFIHSQINIFLNDSNYKESEAEPKSAILQLLLFRTCYPFLISEKRAWLSHISRKILGWECNMWIGQMPEVYNLCDLVDDMIDEIPAAEVSKFWHEEFDKRGHEFIIDRLDSLRSPKFIKRKWEKICHKIMAQSQTAIPNVPAVRNFEIKGMAYLMANKKSFARDNFVAAYREYNKDMKRPPSWLCEAMILSLSPNEDILEVIKESFPSYHYSLINDPNLPIIFYDGLVKYCMQQQEYENVLRYHDIAIKKIGRAHV